MSLPNKHRKKSRLRAKARRPWTRKRWRTVRVNQWPHYFLVRIVELGVHPACEGRRGIGRMDDIAL